jgi:hypothetical protein
MASWRDLEPRVKALRERGFLVKTSHRGTGLPEYLKSATEESAIYILSAKDVSVDDTLCVVRLEWLEKMIDASRQR